MVAVVTVSMKTYIHMYVQCSCTFLLTAKTGRVEMTLYNLILILI